MKPIIYIALPAILTSLALAWAGTTSTFAGGSSVYGPRPVASQEGGGERSTRAPSSGSTLTRWQQPRPGETTTRTAIWTSTGQALLVATSCFATWAMGPSRTRPCWPG